MSSGTSIGGSTAGGGGVGGALSLMSCVREASPSPKVYHSQHPPQNPTPMDVSHFTGQHNVDPLPKEPKKRRFHPFRGLRKIFRRKSRGAADAGLTASNVESDQDAQLRRAVSEDNNKSHPAIHSEKVCVRSASELLIDFCDRDSTFERTNTRQDSYPKLRGESGKLSVSHDSVFPGDVTPTRGISSLNNLITSEAQLRIQKTIEHRIQSSSKNSLDSVEIRQRPKQYLSPDSISSASKENLPNLSIDSLNHTAAHHRISIRPRNRRPPRRVGSTILEETMSESTNNENILIEINEEQIAHLHNENKTEEIKVIANVNKSSETQSPVRKPSSIASLSPDSLDTISASRSSVDEQLETIKSSVIKKVSDRTSQGSDLFDEFKVQSKSLSSNRLSSKSPDSLERNHPCFFNSTEGFEQAQPTPVKRLSKLNDSMSKSSDGMSKSSDNSFEAIQSLASDDSIERGYDDFKIRPRRSSELISKSTENFETLKHIECIMDTKQELKKRNSISDVNLTKERKISKTVIKSSQEFEKNDTTCVERKQNEIMSNDRKLMRKNVLKKCPKKMSSESLDNLELDDRLENRRVRRPSKKEFNSNMLTVVVSNDVENNKKPPIIVRKPSSRLQTSSESSELDSTDTFDFERRNKSSESTETLDSLEKDSEQEVIHNINTHSVDKQGNTDSWSSDILAAIDSDRISIADGEADSQSFISQKKSYWRQSSETTKNLDIHQFLAITIMTRMTDNGNNEHQQRTSLNEPRNERRTHSLPTSPVIITQHDDNQSIFDRLIAEKNNEDLENMLNGNISDASIETKSFKEKLTMFEKLGK